MSHAQSFSLRFGVWFIACAGMGFDRTPGFAQERAELLRQPVTSIDIVQQEVVPKLMSWRERIHNIQLDYHMVRVGTDGKPVDRRVERVEWLYNSRRQLSFHQWVEEDGKTVSRKLEVLNRQSRFQAFYPEGESDLAKPAEIRPITDIPWQYKDEIIPMRGVWLPALERWLPYMLMEVPYLSAEWHDVEGHSCLKIQLDARKVDSSTWYLDPQYEFLPRMFTKQGEVIVVEEFRQVTPETVFPWKGRFIRSSAAEKTEERRQWQIDTIQLNQELDENAFESPLDGKGIFATLFQNQVPEGRIDMELGKVNPRAPFDDLPPRSNTTTQKISISDIWTGVAVASVVGLVIGSAVWLWRKRRNWQHS